MFMDLQEKFLCFHAINVTGAIPVTREHPYSNVQIMSLQSELLVITGDGHLEMTKMAALRH